jgi:hypothetical protein
MKHQTKVLLKVFGILALALIIFLFGIGAGSVGKEPECPVVECTECVECAECEVCEVCETCQEPEVVVKEVEKIVYRDSKEALDLIVYHKTMACAFATVYPSMFDVTKAYAKDWGLSHMVTKDMTELEKIANDYLRKYCD